MPLKDQPRQHDTYENTSDVSFALLPSGQMHCPLQFPRVLNIFLLHCLPDGSESLQLTVYIHMLTS